MKYILKITFLFVLLITAGSYTYADCANDSSSAECLGVAGGAINSGAGGNIEAEGGVKTVKIVTTEKIPGIVCNPLTDTVRDYASDETGENYTDSEVENGTFECLVPIGFQGALVVMGSMIRWLTGIAMICAVLFLVFNGIRLSTSGVDGEAKGKVKTQIMATIGGIILLLLSGPLLKLIAPWIYR